jgi:hypothetical protein
MLSKMWIRGVLNCLTHLTVPQTIRVPPVFKFLGRLCVINLAVGARAVSAMFDGCQPSSDDVDVSVPTPKSFSPKLTARSWEVAAWDGVGSPKSWELEMRAPPIDESRSHTYVMFS